MSRGGLRKGGITDPLVNLEPGDNAKYLNAALQVAELGKNKIDLSDPDPSKLQVRIQEYFDLMATQDKKPTYTGLAMAIGITRATLYTVIKDIPTGTWARNYCGHTHTYASKACRELILQAVDVMTILWEDYMQNGKINPASGIFIGKNFYNMRDEVEHVITPNTNPLDEMSTDDIAQRYLNDKNNK